jgi:dolichol kinase
MLPRMAIRVKGTTGLLVAAAIIVFFLVALPAYRVFFAISIGLGVVIAAALYLRNKYFPVSDKDVENKRPLGLD